MFTNVTVVSDVAAVVAEAVVAGNGILDDGDADEKKKEEEEEEEKEKEEEKKKRKKRDENTGRDDDGVEDHSPSPVVYKSLNSAGNTSLKKPRVRVVYATRRGGVDGKEWQLACGHWMDGCEREVDGLVRGGWISEEWVD